jgi:hypothetical protein
MMETGNPVAPAAFDPIKICNEFAGKLHFGFMCQLWNIRRAILIVCIRVDDDVGAMLQAGSKARHESSGEALVRFVPHNVFDSVFERNTNGIVVAAVIHYQPFHAVKTWHASWKLRQSDREGTGLIVTGDLNDQFRHTLIQTSGKAQRSRPQARHSPSK